MTSSTASDARASRLLSHAMLSLIDQACLSALNLVLGILLIRAMSKADYGIYAQVFAAGLFTTSVLESLVFNPMVNLISGQTRPRREGIETVLNHYQARIATAMAAALGLLAAAVALWMKFPQPWLLGLAFGLFTKANASREYARSVAFLNKQPARVLRLDLGYIGITLAGLGLLFALDAVTIPGIFGLFALANLVAWAGTRKKAGPHPASLVRKDKVIHEAWRRGRLGLPGAAMAWVVNYSYLYLAAAWLGATAPAELNASRLLLMPLSLCVVAWARVARPIVGDLMARQAAHSVHRLLGLSVGGLLLLVLSYSGLLWLLFPWLKIHVLGGKYDAVGPLLFWWSVYFALYTTRWVGTVALLGQDSYGFMLVESVLSFIGIFIALKVAIAWYGVPGAILALIAVEIFSLVMTWGRYGYQRARHPSMPPH